MKHEGIDVFLSNSEQSTDFSRFCCTRQKKPTVRYVHHCSLNVSHKQDISPTQQSSERKAQKYCKHHESESFHEVPGPKLCNWRGKHFQAKIHDENNKTIEYLKTPRNRRNHNPFLFKIRGCSAVCCVHTCVIGLRRFQGFVISNRGLLA